MLLVVFAVLLPVFALLPQLRARSMERIDAMLRSRAMGALDDKWLAGPVPYTQLTLPTHHPL